MKVYYEIKDMLEKELEQIANKRELTSSNLEVMDKVVDIIKDIETICAMKEASDGYSNYMPMYMYDDGMSYARGRGRYAKRDSMGRYARRGGSYDNSYDDMSYDDMSYDDGYARRNRNSRYSRADAKEDLMNERKMNNALS